MAKKIKKTRKELLKEPDEFINLTGKLIRFAGEHKNQITYAVGIIVALVLVFSGYRFFSIRSERRASELLDQGLAKYEKFSNDRNPVEAYDQVSADFQSILDNYGSKQNGEIARLRYANICYKAAKYEQAIELYKISLRDFADDQEIHSLVLGSLGYAYEQQSDYANAVTYFEKLSSAPDAIIRGEALYRLGWLYDKLGDTEKSYAAYNKIISDHQDFIYIDLVKERMAG